MRLRYVKNARELIESNPKLIVDIQKPFRLHLEDLFSNQNPLHLEIGMGKGQFIYTLAKQNPDINYIGIEKFDSAIVKALEKVIDEPLSNLLLLRADAIDILELFDEDAIDRIYLNFSDPWPKERHQKRRLTSPNFLKKYQILLKDCGDLHFKTDNIDFFNYSVDTIREFPMNILFLNYDLHQEDVENIMTEFEEKFSNQGYKINKIIATFEEDTNG